MKTHLSGEEIEFLVKIAMSIKNTLFDDGWADDFWRGNTKCKCLICDGVFHFDDIHVHGKQHIEEYKKLLPFI